MLTLEEFMDELGRVAQKQANDLGELAKAAYLANNIDDGQPDLTRFRVGPNIREFPTASFRHHVPLGAKKITFDTTHELLVLGEPVAIAIHADYQPLGLTPEGISLLQEQLINAHHHVNVVDNENDENQE